MDQWGGGGGGDTHLKCQDSYCIMTSWNKLKLNINLGLSSLMVAVQEGHNDVVQTLLQHGADINYKNKDGK